MLRNYTVDDFFFPVIVERIVCQIMAELKSFVHFQIKCEFLIPILFILMIIRPVFRILTSKIVWQGFLAEGLRRTSAGLGSVSSSFLRTSLFTQVLLGAFLMYFSSMSIGFLPLLRLYYVTVG